MAFNSYDLTNTSLVKTGILTEMYIPLYFYSSGHAGTSNNPWQLLQKGTISTTAATSGNSTSPVLMHTLSSSWSSTQKFAFEASIYTSVSGQGAYAVLWDITANTPVTSSQVSTSSATTSQLFRSGQFTLTPGHAYGVAIEVATAASSSAFLSKASLIAFLS